MTNEDNYNIDTESETTGSVGDYGAPTEEELGGTYHAQESYESGSAEESESMGTADFTQFTNPTDSVNTANFMNQSAAPSYEAIGEVTQHYGLKLTFAILEIVSIIFCNVLGLIFGIIGCVYSNRAREAYKKGDGKGYRDANRTTVISLTIGGVGAAIALVFWIAIIAIIYNLSGTLDLEQPLEEYLEDNFNDSDIYGDDDYYSYGGNDSNDDYNYVDNGPQDHSALGEWYKLELNDVEISLPTTVDAFLATGYTIDESIEDAEIDADDYAFYRIYDEDGTSIGWINVSNLSDQTIRAMDGVLYEIDLENPAVYYDGEITPDVTYYDGITFHTDTKKLLKKLGTPENETTMYGDGYEAVEYRWYLGGDGDYLAGIDVYVIDGKIEQIQLIREQE